VPPYLLVSMAACDGAWEAPAAMRDFIALPPAEGDLELPDAHGEPAGPGRETRRRIATRARRTLLLDQALLHERATTHTDIARLLDPAGRLVRAISDAQGAETTPGTAARTEGQDPGQDPDANRAYDGLGEVYEF